MVERETYRIRPAGRHILTIGRDLVQDPYAAVIELVKNAYDADSPSVVIAFEQQGDKDCYITIEDSGHGMTRDTVVNKWLVPSTSDKKIREGRSPTGRIMQGRKGIGRFAASVLGKDLYLETTTDSGQRTTLFIQWDDFEAAEHLEDVEILIDSEDTNQKAGTKLKMAIREQDIGTWNQSQIRKLQFELRKLIPPFPNIVSKQTFSMVLRVSGMGGMEDIDNEIEPFPLVEHYDYRIAGKIETGTKARFRYSQQKSLRVPDEEIEIEVEGLSGCGELELDIRVYDRDPASVDQLILRGLKDEAGNYLGKSEARNLLNEYNGIGVYRNGFRLRPLGDPEFDWLKLNEQRVQKPAFRIGNNQVIGYVLIQSEEQSNLIEKSGRDGLIENEAFGKLKEITKAVIGKLEERRYLYRKQEGLGRKTFKTEQELEKLYSFDILKDKVRKTLNRAQVHTTIREKVVAHIEEDEKRKSETVKRLRDAIAVYQGQATLGKIINVVLHEGRRPLNHFRNRFPLLEKYAKQYSKTDDPYIVPKIVDLAKGISENAREFVLLFSRLDPLAARRRTRRKLEKLIPVIRSSYETFSRKMESKNVKFLIEGDESFTFLCWKQDIQTIFTNLIDNSLYWLNKVNHVDKHIKTRISICGNRLVHIDYTDTGPGIEPKYIENEVIFEPHFSTKPDGTGLGLAIAGEAATRNQLVLKAFESKSGSWFRIQPNDADVTE
ncbi:MAG: sensor histidine kinase [Gammaproteobacteria bacterium]|nr:sensor histidine kinase [Gammaproteobacteria bacterium]MDE0252940.1 sensor histidine kinase [Gammaproteobacteria bacterium]MDE0402047.1 sensor histidine kinase [Gammaproteobacteria bacterium]